MGLLRSTEGRGIRNGGWPKHFEDLTFAFVKLQQDQVWKVGDEFVRVVRLERLAVEYKAMKNLVTREGTRYRVTKKQFCTLIKKAALLPAAEQAIPTAPRDTGPVPTPQE